MRGRGIGAATLLPACMVLLMGSAIAQQRGAERTASAAQWLRAHDPMHDGAGAAELLPADRSLDAAIGELARNGTERVVQRRALRLWRALGLAERVRTDPAPHGIAFWLAFAELDTGMPEPVRSRLLKRAFADAQAAALRSELAAGSAAARAFCTEWNEVGQLGGAEAQRYDELEAALKKAGAAAAPHLLEVLGVLPVLSFTDEEPVSARAQVRAILGLAVHLDANAAMPAYVMHAAGPSLTQTSNAAAAVQKFAGEAFGAGLLQRANDEALLAWWRQHRDEHEVVLDHLVHHVVRLARIAMAQPGSRGDNACQAAPHVLDRLLGNVAIPSKDAARNVLADCVQLAEDEWLLHRANGKALAK